MANQPMNPAERERRIIVRAGLFVAIGLALAAIVVFVIGKERNLFSEQDVYTGAFENVDGLQLDSPVRLGGLQVGRVTKISFAPDLGDKRIIVTMEIVAKYRERLRRDSVARIAGRGVLGDKAIDISLGSPDKPELKPGSEIETGASGDISSVLKATGEILDNTLAVTRDLKTGVAAYTNPELRQDVAALVKSARGIVSEIEGGKGVLHTLVYDRKTDGEVRALLAQLTSSAQRLDGAIARVDGLLADVKNGDGSLHALVYDKKLTGTLTEVGDAAEELARLIHDAKTTKDGAVYQLVYGDARTLLGDLGVAASDMKQLAEKVKAGEGTVGLLLKDPSVYEDLKELLGNVKRNRVLRELVRYSLDNGEKLEKVGQPVPK